MATELSKIRKALIEQGWRLDDSGKHLKAFAPDGRTIVVFPRTPSDHRSLTNAIAIARRAGFIWPTKGGK